MSQYLLVYPAWSIGLELWFYLLVPFFALWRTSSLVIVSAVSFSLRFAMEWNAPWSSYFFFPANLCFFVVGILAYRVYRSERYQHVTTRAQAKLVLVLVVLTLLFRQYIPFYRNYDWLLYTLFGVTLPWLFYASKHWRFDRWVGNLSYPVYLLHAFILLLLGVRYGTDDGLLAVGLSTSAALAFLVAVERPLERVRQRRVAKALAVKQTEPRMTLSLVLEVPQKALSS